MKIDFIKIKNFRKLNSCKIEFSEKETIFVGANNSGKTTAMDALITFLKRKEFKTQDFTISNWTKLNKIAETWVTKSDLIEEDKSLKLLEPYLPSLDLWIHAENSELRYVSHLIPTLDWKGGLLGIRLILQPKNIEILIEDYIIARNKVIKLNADSGKKIDLWPKDFWQFCDRKLNTLFEIKTYILDPTKYNIDQELTDYNIAFEGNPLNGLIKIDTINAQRGFSDVNSDNLESQNAKNLSSQLRSYYDNHLNPTTDPTGNDLDALNSLNKAQAAFDKNLQVRFKESLGELEGLNYPGFGNPQITLSSLIKASDGLDHDSAVRYQIDKGITLPEKYNGLGYQNLISIIFKLIRYRDEWMRKGKLTNDKIDIIEPLHLVLIEEPEAHLHAQVQQVFIKKAYSVLRKHSDLEEEKHFNTQLIISTHSSYIAHQKFESLRYFKRNNSLKIPTSEVISLKSVFDGSKSLEKETEKFVVRYLNTTHNDLFFADAAILVEGPAERMLIPHFIKNKHEVLDSCYITILEIGGSHAHRLKALIEKLGLITLIITDIDAVEKIIDNYKNAPKEVFVKCQPKKGFNQKTNNDTLKEWNPKLHDVSKLLELESKGKVLKNNPIRVAYQTEIDINGTKTYPYTFEDALVLENVELFKKIIKPKGLLKKMVEAAKETKMENVAVEAFKAINADGAKKAEFALDVLYFENPENLNTPKYIEEGLNWVEEKLTSNKNLKFPKS
ncbi:putative ATP-dependent endonuclease of OLD family [Flavobacterium sp. 28A]|uniref:ATP-dependent endonuclease n=1 Tax=Flavobacterium sp. 28A TaxID=2735895 RepID=UPI0015700AC6|nr:AAA family ATPase [Flavobacterium sp. 28A]NRT15515.1 putative ATP-dependent endonuclease of OLD family [Flavobacterium sp. 28A]